MSWCAAARERRPKCSSSMTSAPRPDNSRYTAELTALAESLARTEFPALLKQLGLAGTSRTRFATTPRCRRTVDERLDQLGLVDHFAAVRVLHEAIRADGESPAGWRRWRGRTRSSAC